MISCQTFSIKLNKYAIDSLSMVQLINLAYTLERLVEEKAPVLSCQDLSSFMNLSAPPTPESLFSIKSYIERQFTEINDNV